MRRYNIIPITLISLGGLLLFGFEMQLLGYGLFALSLCIARIYNQLLARDLLLVVIGIFIISLIPITTDISVGHMLVMGSAMVAAVGVPYIIARFVYKSDVIQFPFHLKEPWDRHKWFYLIFVAVIGFFVLPFYMISSGVYQNWPAVSTTEDVIKLFIGTNILGIWDELFFICTVFVIFQKHINFWAANILQAVLFTSFLYELGFESIGPALIYIFALSQGYIFKQTHSLFYLICIHLLLDLILFIVLLHAHNRQWFPLFFY